MRKSRRSTPGARAGKSPAKQVKTTLTESKYSSGGARLKRKKGGFVRKPKPPIRYSHRKKVVP